MSPVHSILLIGDAQQVNCQCKNRARGAGHHRWDRGDACWPPHWPDKAMCEPALLREFSCASPFTGLRRIDGAGRVFW